jgi:hypothetical protein
VQTRSQNHSTLCQCVLAMPLVGILQFFYHLVLVYEILSPNLSCDIGVVVSLASFSTTNAAPYQQKKTCRAQRHSTRPFAFSLQTRNAASTNDITLHLAAVLFLGCILMARVSMYWAMTRSRHINYNYTWTIRTNPKVVDLARLVAKALIPDQSMHRWCSQAAQCCLTRISRWHAAAILTKISTIQSHRRRLFCLQAIWSLCEIYNPG